jgi:hypothetical protein
MESETFDALIRRVGSAGFRRGVLRVGVTALAASAVSALGLSAVREGDAKKKGKGKKGKGAKGKGKKGKKPKAPVCGEFPTFTGQECPAGSAQPCCEAPSSLEETFDVCCPAGWGRPYGCCNDSREPVCCPPDYLEGCCEVKCCKSTADCSGGRSCFGGCCRF